MSERRSAARWALVLGWALALSGYTGAWVGHRASGLIICGYDLAEYVKFLPQVRLGSVPVWRQWFLLPAAVISLGLTLAAVNRRLKFPWYIAIPMILAGLVSALMLLPPAWTPALLLTPEFRLQSIWFAICLAAMAAAPLLRWLPAWPAQALLVLGFFASAAGAVRQFALLKTAIDDVYGGPTTVGWGLYVFVAAGVALLAATAWGLTRRRRERGIGLAYDLLSGRR